MLIIYRCVRYNFWPRITLLVVYLPVSWSYHFNGLTNKLVRDRWIWSCWKEWTVKFTPRHRRCQLRTNVFPQEKKCGFLWCTNRFLKEVELLLQNPEKGLERFARKERTLKLLKITGRILLTLCPVLSKTKIWSTERSLMNVNTNLSHVERNYARSGLNPGAEPWNSGLPPCAAGTDRVTLELQGVLSNKKNNKKPLQVLAHSFLLMLETPKRELMTTDGNPLHWISGGLSMKLWGVLVYEFLENPRS